MPFKPIDLQTNLSQMLEVGKSEHARSLAATELQHVLEKESDEKGKNVNSKLDEMKKAESSTIRDQEDKEGKKHKEGREDEQASDKDKGEEKKRSQDEKLGRFVDFLK